ncbi:hypothetical protein [Endothiovibrio diazotrophicus]
MLGGHPRGKRIGQTLEIDLGDTFAEGTAPIRDAQRLPVETGATPALRAEGLVAHRIMDQPDTDAAAIKG